MNYEYNASGYLVKYTDATGRSVRYVYGTGGRMSEWYDGNGNRAILNTYDSLGRVLTQTDAEGGVVTFSYEDTSSGGSTLTATDAEGNVTVYTMDDQKRIIKIQHPDGEVIEADHRAWYRELFAPSVTAGLIRASDLAGYRSQQVYIRESLHTPLNPDAVRDAMPAFFELLKNEPDAGVRAVLGHFVFVYIHPYMDGNGRIARFLMNAMLISGGYDWTVVPLERRGEYMAALEKASVEEDITDFAKILSSL